MSIQQVSFISVWNGGFEVETNAKWNTETNVVFNIEVSGIEVDSYGDELEMLEGEYIELSDGTRYECEEHENEYVVIR